MSKDWITPFIESLRVKGVVSAACRDAGITSGMVYALRREDSGFATAWDNAIEDSTDILETEARRRAVDGVSTPVFNKEGNVVGERIAYSDALLALLLKGNRRKKFGDKTEITGADGGALAVVDETKRTSRVAALLALAQSRKDIA